VLVLREEPTLPGCQIDRRLAGVLLRCQVDKEDTRRKRNDRIVGIAQASVLFADVGGLADLPAVLLQQVEDFFVNYQKLRDVELNTAGPQGTHRQGAYSRQRHQEMVTVRCADRQVVRQQR
jgi:inorganic pyrophosphatase